MNAYEVFEEFRKYSDSTRQKGDLFEKFIKKYLLTDPLYADVLSDVWLWMEWPGRGSKVDTGIDLIALEKETGDYWAIQCKFFSSNHTIEKNDIDSFLSASGKKFSIDDEEKSFSKRFIVSSTNNWGRNAEDAIANQKIPVTRLRLNDLANAPIDWSKFSIEKPDTLKLSLKKTPRPHQKKAIEDVLAKFKEYNRGKLIMACGTGKTFTSLKIAEEITHGKGTVLFLVPSISLLSQTLREWSAEASNLLYCIAVCSDTKVSKNSEDISTVDLALPASTDPKKIAEQYRLYHKKKGLIVLFSTYQSIDVVAKAQKSGLDEFDLIICDEAHRTTGVTLSGDDESAFVKVHDNKFIKSKKRMYMTATPRIYRDDSKTLAAEKEAYLCSMDDEAIYGQEFHHLGFSEAVGQGLLSDYKVLVLAVDEKHVTKAFQSQLADENKELNLEDTVKIIGCWNGLSKKMVQSIDGQNLPDDQTIDPLPMRRAVAFSSKIADSKKITSLFAKLVNEYRSKYGHDDNMVYIEADHVDGTYNALKRNEKLDWLKAPSEGNTCRILSNARCLSEGVDVPSLDAVIFLSPRNSVVDVVQSVGRVMRKSEGKKYGYVILPIGIPSGIEPSEALNDNKRYKVVWDVLQALRAHDDRFNNTINKIDLNKRKPDQIQVIGVGGYDRDDDENSTSSLVSEGKRPPYGTQLSFDFPELENWKNAIYAKIVNKCGSRRYWENWAQDVARIAERHIDRINTLLEDPKNKHKKAFDEFLDSLRKNLNTSISSHDAIEMLAQHLITRPVFDALFEGYSFIKNNPVSISMQKMLDILEEQALEKETETLDKFYNSVKERAKSIDNAEGKQKIIIELYDKFFKSAFPKMVEKLGIVYTPVEVVDFIIHSVEYILQKEFSSSITNKNVHILDPFTGTGTFIVRLLQNGIIKTEDLKFKYKNEIHANEIVLLAYYIAAINIEEAFHEVSKTNSYDPFEGIVLTDTFQMTETDGTFGEKMFPENSERAAKQKKTDIRVIIGNPPYSIGQESANDNNQNISYPRLESAITSSYAKHSNANLKKGLYDSYIKAFRWATDRIKDKGIVCFVSNGAYIDNQGMDGFRKCLADDFTSIYCFNLRGNQRTAGETSRKEGGKIFGSGSRTPIAITLLIKHSEKQEKGKVFYHDIGDYLSREEKLNILKELHDISSIDWIGIDPNESHDWINQRNDEFSLFIPTGDKQDKKAKTVFEPYYSLGIASNRDVWVYNFSDKQVASNMKRMIEFYNEQVDGYIKAKKKNANLEVEEFIDKDMSNIKWTVNLKNDLERTLKHTFNKKGVVQGLYRPYCKQWMYFDRGFNERVLQIPKLFPTKDHSNHVISVSGIGASKDFSAIITNVIPDLQLQFNGQCFPLYYYQEIDEDDNSLFKSDQKEKYIRRDGVTDFILKRFREHYDPKIKKDDIFYYVYGIFHSPEYKYRFESDLKKMLPRLPLAKDFWDFSKAGRDLAKLHLNYETIEPYKLKETGNKTNLKVEKMSFGKIGKEVDKTIIIYNSHLTLSGIPLEAYEYFVNGKSAIEWIMERYQVKIDSESGIKNDPNDWSEDERYIVDLIKRIVSVSLDTIKIVKSLPELNELK